MLSDSESDSEDVHQLTINEHYAKAFEYRKEREELEKLKEKYGSDIENLDEDNESETASESAESEDEDGEELTPTVDAAILRTLAKIKRQDPDIYDSNKGIFEEEQKKITTTKPFRSAREKPSKPVTLRQAVLESTLNNTTSRSPSPELPTHVEEQRALRDETIAAFHQSVEGDDEDDDFLVLREKTKDEQEQEEENYRAFLEREVGGDLEKLVTVEPGSETWIAQGEDAAEQAQSSKKKKKKSKEKGQEGESPAKNKEGEDQEFLMNYILNRGWIDRSVRHVPTFQEITSKSKGKGKEVSPDPDADEEKDEAPELDEEEEFDEIVDRFESSYNFRFEEPDADTIKAYPRNIPSLVRREDTTRKEARERRKARKEEEMQKKREEIRRLKTLKMKEIRAKLDKIGKEGGKSWDADPALQQLNLDADWDPDSHDQQMAGLYGEDGNLDDEKPVWENDIDIGDIPMSDNDNDFPSTKMSKKALKKQKKKKNDDTAVEEGGVNVDDMDADRIPAEDEEEWDGTEEMRKRKLDEYLDEIYGLDFNDMVGDMPTRFHYTRVQPQNYALTPVEILMATDGELNEYMSVKKYAPYKTNKDIKWDATRNERLKELKGKISERTSGSRPEDAIADERPVKKRMGKKERMKRKLEAGVNGQLEAAEDNDVQVTLPEVQEPAKKKRRKHKEKEKGVA